MANKIFKGFQQVTEGNFEAESGYLYLVRNQANSGATDGYIQFNGKKYGTAAEAAAELEGKIGVLPEGYDNLVDYIDAQASAVTENYATKETVGTLSGRVDTLEAISAGTRIADLESISADTRISELEDIDADNRLADLEGISADTRISVLELSAHTHSNKDVLDAIDQSKVNAWDAMASGAAVVISAYTGDNSGITEGYLKTYEIFQGGVSMGKIDIPKDLVVSSGQIVEENGVKYLRLTIANQSEPVDIAVTDLVDVYTAGDGIEISNNNEISAKVVEGNGLSVDESGITMSLADASNAGAMSAADFNKLASIEASAQTNVIEEVQVNGTALTITDKAVNIVLPSTEEFEDLEDRVEALEAVSADTRISVLEDIDADNRIAALEAVSADTRLDVIEDDYLTSADKTELEGEIGTVSGRVDTLEAISAGTRLDALEALTADTASALQSVSAGDASISVENKDANNDQAISVAISAASGNTLSLESDGLFAAIYYDGNDSE